MKRRLPAVLAVLIIIIVFFTGFFIKKERDFRENFLLKKENEELKVRIQKSQLPIANRQLSNDYLSAKVFSTYPFNFKNKITVNVGEKNGVKKSAAVTLGENILVGQIIDIERDFSVVRTIFDPGWQLPVRIGKEEINGLLRGGNEPKIVLIENDKFLEAGVVVYSAGGEIPYGLKVGEIKEIGKDAMGVFKEAFLKMPFNVGDLREVNVEL